MSELDIIRAWKDKTYRNSLSADELAQLPEHPSGAIELTDHELDNVEGGTTATSVSIYVSIYVTIFYCTLLTVPSCCPCPPPPFPY